MADKCDFRIRGRLSTLNASAGTLPVALGTVRILSASREELFAAPTDEQGYFTIALREVEAKAFLGELYARSVLVTGSPGTNSSPPSSTAVPGATEVSLTLPMLRGFELLDVKVPEVPSSSDPCRYVVTGRAVDAEGRGQPGATVRAYDRGLGSVPDTLIGSTTAGADGSFLLEYTLAPPCDPAFPRVNLVVKGSASGQRVESGLEGPFCNPQARHPVRLTLSDAAVSEPVTFVEAPESERVFAALTSQVVASGLALGDVDEEGRGVLHQRTGVPRELVDIAVAADFLATATSVAAEVFYGLGRQGVAMDISALMTPDRAEHERLLREAVARRRIPQAVLDTLPASLDALASLRVSSALGDVATGDPTLLLDVFTGASLTATDASEFFTRYHAHTGDIADFWASLRADSAQFGDAKVDRIQMTLVASALVANHLPLVNHLQTLWGTTLQNMRDLAKLSEADWRGFLDLVGADGTAIGTPDGFPGATDSERRDRYAQTIRRMVEDRLPTEFVAYHITPTLPSQAQVATFMDANPRFDFATTVIEDFWAGAAGLPADPAEAAQLKDDLKKVQRVFNIAPRRERSRVTNALLEGGFGSALQVASMGRAGFVRKAATMLGGDLSLARRVYETAQTKTNLSLYLFGRVAPQMTGPKIGVVQLIGCDDVDVSSLFGSQDFCACAACNSIHGPAAYLADLLHWIDNRDALAALTERRPELVQVDLNCENTNTVLPTIDLVNEVLEREVVVAVDGALPGDYEFPQTTWTAPELLAEPEHVLDRAYEILADGATVHPWILPFGRPLAEARVHLAHLGVSRPQLLEVMTSFPDNTVALPAGYDLGDARRNERLAITKAIADLVIAPSVGFGALWGLGAGQTVADLKRVPLFLLQSGLTFDGLEELLRTELGADLQVVFADGSCSLDQATLEPVSGAGLTEGLATRIQAFLRVRDAGGWSTGELDAALRAVGKTLADPAAPGGPDETAAALARLAAVERLRERFGHLALGTILAWFGDLDLHPWQDGALSFYEQLASPRNAAEALQVNATGDDLVGNATYAEVEGDVLGVLRLSSEDLAAAFGRLGGLGPGSTVDIASLTRLYRVASLAATLGVSVDELVFVTELTNLGDKVFDGAADANIVRKLVRLMDRTEEVQASPFDFEQLAFLLGTEHEDTLGVPDERAALILTGLIATLQSVSASEASKVPAIDLDPVARAEQVLRRYGYAEADHALAVGLVDGTADYGALPDVAATVAELFPFVSDTAVLATLETPLAGRAAGDTEAAAGGVVDAGTADLRQRALRNAATQTLATALERSPGDTLALLTHMQQDVPGDTVSALERLTDDAFFDPSVYDPDTQGGALGTPEFVAAFVADPEVAPRVELLRRLQKAAVLLAGFAFEDRQLQWLLDAPSTPPFDSLALDVVNLPVTGFDPGGTLHDRFERWRWMRRAASLRDERFDDPYDVFELVTAADGTGTKAAYRALLAERSGIAPEDVDGLMKNAGLGWGKLRALTVLEEAFVAFDTAARLGVAAAIARAWGQGFEPDLAGATEVLPSTAEAIRGAAKAKHDVSAWPAVAEPLRGRLREQQRDALLAWLMSSRGVDDVNEFFADLLTDVAVSACGKTSRLKFATAAAQTFVQRALMDVEPAVSLGQDDAREWVWMGRFRVWEANRKIFLYPENFLAPQLRQDKTPQFRRLEEALTRSELDKDAVDEAYLEYLRELNEISRLEIAGVHSERERDAEGNLIRDVLHVFGRAKGQPSKLYYRQHVGGAYWTPWEELPFETESPHVLPYVHNRRLFLFWPRVEERGEQKESVGEGEKTPRVAKVSLGWAEQWQGTWRGPRQTKQSFEQNPLPTAGLGSFGGSNTPGERRFDRLFLHAKPRQDGGFQVDIAVPDPPNSGAIQTLGAYRYGGCDDEFVLIPHVFPVQQLAGPFAQAEAIARNSQEAWIARSVPYNAQPRFQAFHQLPGKDDLSINSVHGVTGAPEPQGRLLTHPDWEVTGHHCQNAPLPTRPFFYQDAARTFFVDPRDETRAPGNLHIDQFPPNTLAHTTMNVMLLAGELFASPWLPENVPVPTGYRMFPHYHPYVCEMIRQVRVHGVAGLLDPPEDSDLDGASLRYQAAVREPVGGPDDEYDPSFRFLKPFPREDFDFGATGAYAIYNWELFVYAPLFIAERLISEAKFPEARKWLHYIFDPTQGGIFPPNCLNVWKTKPLKEEQSPESIQQLLDALSYKGTDPELAGLRDEVLAEVEAWKDRPFDPHFIARMRPQAYQRAVFMKYLDLLIAWGDHLFRQDSRESNNEATQLYILAHLLLGRRPVEVDARTVEDKTYDEAGTLDAFSNFFIQVENNAPGPNLGGTLFAQDAVLGLNIVAQPEPYPAPPQPPLTVLTLPPPPSGGDLVPYFCIPPNRKLLGYWDTVDDRLFKLRNCLNIEGVFRELPLFQPPINPALIAAALAQGVDLGSAIAGIHAPVPHYRFTFMLQVAKDLAAEVRALGAALLSALERKDAEALATLQARQQTTLLRAVEAVREQQIAEAAESRQAAEAAEAAAITRLNYYSDRERMNLEEKAADLVAISAFIPQVTSTLLTAAAGAMSFVPQFEIGVQGAASSPVTTFSLGGQQIAAALSSHASISSTVAGILGGVSALLDKQANYTRRKEEWDFQADLARRDLDGARKQIAAAKIREAITKLELENHRLQVEQSLEVEAYYRDKFTNEELYSFLVDELSGLYLESYNLAVDVARRAERCYRLELGEPGASFIEFGHWDNRRKGLLAGERLTADLRRMETSYLDKNRREYELRKRVSLAELDPLALETLKSTGEAQFMIPDWYLNLDHPSHYLRRIRLVGVTVPVVTGPFATVPVTVQYQRGELVTDPLSPTPVADISSTLQTVATSTGDGDTGLHETSMRDERYLPFELKALDNSAWRVSLPKDVRPFDYQTITDVVLEIRYTAREGGESLAQVRTTALQDLIADTAGNLHYAISLRGRFPDAFAQFVTAAGPDPAVASVTLSEDDFPHLPVAGGVQLRKVTVLLWRGGSASVIAGAELSPGGVFDFPAGTLQSSGELDLGGQAPGPFTLTAPGGFPDTEPGVEDLLLVFKYSVGS